MNPSPHSWIFTSFSVDSCPYSYLCTSATVRIPVHAALKRGTEPQRYLICNAPLSWSARRSFSPKQKSRQNHRFMCEQKPYPIWFSCRRTRKSYPIWREWREHSVKLDSYEKCYQIWNGYLYFLNWFISQTRNKFPVDKLSAPSQLVKLDKFFFHWSVLV